MQLFQTFSKTAVGLFLPRYCCVCGKGLNSSEEVICSSCLLELPRPDFPSFNDNPLVRRFWGKAPIQKGTSLLYYIKETDYQHIFGNMKYNGRVDLCHRMGELLACYANNFPWEEPSQSEGTEKKEGFFDGIDFIVPIPLYPKRQKERGYNQAEEIAKGINKITNIPLCTTVVRRIKNTKSQTTLSPSERQENTRDAFSASEASHLNGKHLLIIDDTITTGSTIISLMEAILKEAPQCTFSVVSIGLAKQM